MNLIGLCAFLTLLLTIALVLLKLAHVIAWSWWLVVSPLWVGLVLVIVAAIVLMWYLRMEDLRAAADDEA